MLIYIAGPYRADTKQGIAKNIAEARKVAIEVWQAGNVAICPHLNTAHFEEDANLDDSVYLEGDLQILARCDAILLMDTYKSSQGALSEAMFAEENKIPIYYYPNIPQPHPTEAKRPQQVRTFIQIVMEMYRTHLDKNNDYSPANLAGTGEIGVLVRLWDKTARLMNLLGFDVEISKSNFREPQTPKYEAIVDSIMDAGVYCVNWLILRSGRWGR